MVFSFSQIQSPFKTHGLTHVPCCLSFLKFGNLPVSLTFSANAEAFATTKNSCSRWRQSKFNAAGFTDNSFSLSQDSCSSYGSTFVAYFRMSILSMLTRAGKQFKILDSIIGFNMVYVMDNLSALKKAFNMCFHDKTVFSDITLLPRQRMVWPMDIPIACSFNFLKSLHGSILSNV